MRVPQRAEALGDLYTAPFPLADLAQILEQRNGSVVVGRALAGDQSLHAPPRVSLALRQEAQMTVTSGGQITLPSYALLGFTREDHLSPLFREFLRSRTQRASGAERLRCFEPRLLPAEPAHQLGAHARLATSDAGEQRHLVVLIECGDPSIDFLGTRYGRRAMHDKDAARMAGFSDVPDAAVRAVRAPTLIIMGDRDVARLEHAIELSRLFPDARLLVLPSGHGDYLAEASSASADTDYAEITARLVDRFLSEPQSRR